MTKIELLYINLDRAEEGYERGNDHFRLTEEDKLHQRIATRFLLLQGNVRKSAAISSKPSK
jgi:hypothetical protein